MLGMEARPQGHHDCVQRGAFYSETSERKGAYCAARVVKHAVSCRPNGHDRSRKG